MPDFTKDYFWTILKQSSMTPKATLQQNRKVASRKCNYFKDFNAEDQHQKSLNRSLVNHFVT